MICPFCLLGCIRSTTSHRPFWPWNQLFDCRHRIFHFQRLEPPRFGDRTVIDSQYVGPLNRILDLASIQKTTETS